MPKENDQSVDGYWKRMGALATDALSTSLHPDLTLRRRELIAEYLGVVMDNAYNMGIRLGRLQAQTERENESQEKKG